MAIALFFMILLVGISFVLARSGAPATTLAGGPSVSPGSEELVERFIERSRRYRRGGAWAGIVLAVLVAVIAEAEGHPLLGERGVDLGVLFAIGLGGSVAGSVAAEAFRFRAPRGPRTASLEVRDLARYDDPVTARRERAVGCVAVVAAVCGVAIGSPTVALWLVPIALLALLGRWATRRIALRARPALSPDLQQADDQVRLLAASSGLGRPLATLSLLLLSFQLGALADAAQGWVDSLADPFRWASAVPAVCAWGAFAAVVLAVVWWAQNRSFGLAHGPSRPRSAATYARAALIACVVLVPILVLVAARG